MTITEINAEINSLCSSTDTSYIAADKLRRVNSALETLIAKIINADGTWQWDDTNYTDLPVGTGDLVDAQSSYSFAVDFLDIENVKIKDINGIWSILQPIDQSQLDYPLEDHLTDDGMPIYYDKVGDTIKLYPAPDTTVVTATAGIKVQFKRTASVFTSAQVTTGTKTPGIASPFHILIPYMASIPYCMAFKKDRVGLYEKRVDDGIKEMIMFYSRREKDKRKVLTMGGITHR